MVDLDPRISVGYPFPTTAAVAAGLTPGPKAKPEGAQLAPRAARGHGSRGRVKAGVSYG